MPVKRTLKRHKNAKSKPSTTDDKTKKTKPQKKVLFIMFQGSGTNIKNWNETTESKFLDKLKQLGSVYTYQDKTHNIHYYNKTNPEHKDFDPDIDIDLSYVNPDTHVKMVYKDILQKYTNISEYIFIPVGWSAGCYLALYFAQIYTAQCGQVILLDSALWTPHNITKRMKALKHNIMIRDKTIFPITNTKYKKMLQNLKEKFDEEDMYTISNIQNYIRTLFISKHLKLQLPVPTLAFVNVQEEEKSEWSARFNNDLRLAEVDILEIHNPEYYKAFTFMNNTHYIFNMIEPTTKIIEQIKSAILTINK